MFDWASIMEEEASEERLVQTEAGVVAWINANPPELPEVQNHCAACGESILFNDTGWVCLADGALIHYSGSHGLTCWEAWKKKRRETAHAALCGERQADIDGDVLDKGPP